MATPLILTPLRNGRFVTMWAGQSFALLGAEFHMIALAWMALELTGSGLALGSVLLAGMLPRILFTLLGGVAADRYDFRRVMVVSNTLRAVLVGGFAMVVVTDRAVLWQLYALAVVLGSITSFYQPAFYTAVPRLCDQEQLRQANALMRGTAETIGMVGPLTAGVVVATAGLGAGFWVTAGCYLVASVTLVALLRLGPAAGTAAGAAAGVPRPDRSERVRSVVREVRQGAATVRRDPQLMRIMALIFAAGLALTGPITVGVPWLAQQEFGGSASVFGLLISMWMVGSVSGAAIVGSVGRLPGWRPLILSVTAVLAAGLAAIGLGGHVLIVAASLLAMGVAAGFFNVLILTWMQRRSSESELGRVMSFVELAEVLTTPASYLLAGLFLEISVPAVFLVAAGLLVVSALGLSRSPALRGADGPEAEPGPATDSPRPGAKESS
jgi:MFS family permease